MCSQGHGTVDWNANTQAPHTSPWVKTNWAGEPFQCYFLSVKIAPVTRISQDHS